MMQPKITIEIWQKGRWFISKCPELDFISQGASPEEAKRNLLEVIQIQFEEMAALGTLEDYLLECGFVRENGSFTPQLEMVGLERSALQVT
jgi:predicted RNase H-like HicB family nuclease